MEELVRQTGLKPKIIQSLINECHAESKGKDQPVLSKQMNDEDSLANRPFHLIVGAVISLLTCLIYTPALNNGFVWDDTTYVLNNTFIHSLDMHSFYKMLTTFYASNWHPLTWFSHAVDYALWGTEPFGHHLTNIILHGINTFLVFFLVTQLMLRARGMNVVSPRNKMLPSISFRSLVVAAVSALLFGLHPLHVESVAWVAERKDLLCPFFSLFTMISYLSYASSAVRRQRWIGFAACLTFFVFALMSKPMAVTLPIILLLLDIYPIRRFSPRNMTCLPVIWEKIPFFMLSTASGIITIMSQRAGRAVISLEQWDLNSRLLNALNSLTFYLGKMIAPFELVPFYPVPGHIQWHDSHILSSAILVLTITGFCLWMARKGKYLFLTVWLYYVITLLPVIGIVQVGNQAAADRYTYLPSLSIFLLTGIGVSSVFEKCFPMKRNNLFIGLMLILLCAMMLLLGRLTIQQIKIWDNPESLWSHVIEVYPNKVPKAHYNLGLFYAKQGRLDEAIVQFKDALAIDPNYANAHSNLGRAYDEKGMLDEAISECNKTLAIDPKHAVAYNNLGTIFKKKGMLDEAISHHKKALNIKPNYAEAHYNLSVAYYYKQNYESAIVHCDRAIELGLDVYPMFLELLKPYR